MTSTTQTLLTVDVFKNGVFVFSRPANTSISRDMFYSQQFGLTVRETKRTRYHGESRFHVYYTYTNDPTETQTHVFRFASYGDDATEWTVCPRCATQIAIDDYQEAAGMCDQCLIDTTPEPDDDVFSRDRHNPYCLTCCTNEHQAGPCPMARKEDDIALYQRMDDGFRRAQVFARAGILALALFTLGLSGAAAKLSPAQANHVYDAVSPYLPVGCAITHLSEDMGASAVCAGGYVVILDAQPNHKHTDIPFAIGTRVIGPDANGTYWDWAIHD